MSSQGPAVTGSVAPKGFTPDPAAGSPVSAGYAFDPHSIRDAGDWIAYKKQTLVSKESKTKLKSSFPEISYSNSYRVDFLLGRFKNPSTSGCNTCSAGQNALFNTRASDTTPPA